MVSAPKPHRERGLTLVEVLIALTLLVVVLLPVMVAFSQALITTSQSSISAAATSIAREKVEEFKAIGFDDLADQTRQPRDLRPGDSFFEVAATVEIRRPDGPLQEGMKEAQVTVYRTGSSHPLMTVCTYFVRNGI
jgi:prepilin-type N-terminal cleavage/methylation domain-containing protein